MLKHVRRDSCGGKVPLKSSHTELEGRCEQGSGTPKDPFVLPLRGTPNGSGCYHCVEDVCDCLWMTERLEECYNSLPLTRHVMPSRKKEFCAKSVLPPFVSRMVRLAKITSKDTFFDMGCGNGSVLFQVALMTGARCVGVEINERNTAVAKEAWRSLRPTIETRCGNSVEVDIICADFCSLMKDENFFGPSPVIWAANLLLPRTVNHYLSERFRSLPKGSRVLCLEDLYPHGRSVAALRDPDAFVKFTMTDFRWQAQSVEWCDSEAMLFVSSEGKSRLIDLETKAVHRTYATTIIERRGLTYCASSKTVVVHQARGCTSFFSPNSQQPVQRSFTLETITSCLCTHDGVFLIGGTAEGNIYVWNTLTGQLHHLVRGHTQRVTDISISSDQSLVVTASEDSVCKTWSLSSLVSRVLKTVTPCSFFNGHTLGVNTCSFMESGYMVVTGSADRTCRIFNGLTGRPQLVITLDDAVTMVRSSPSDEMLLIGSAKGSLFFVDLYDSTLQKGLPISLNKRNDCVVERKSFEDGHSGPILFIWFDTTRPDFAIVGSESGAVLWWNISTKTIHSEAFPSFPGNRLSICYVPRGSLSVAQWSCAGLMKHPIDPTNRDYIVLSAPNESAREKKPAESSTRRRCRESREEDNSVVKSARVKTDVKNPNESYLKAIEEHKKKNDELETLRDRLQVKLQKLIAS